MLRPSIVALALALSTVLGVLSAPARADLEIGEYEGVPWPIVPPPTRGPLPPAPRFPTPPPAPDGAAAARVVAELARVRGALTSTRYQHATVVREREGVFLWDCSGMAAWVLRRAAPGAMRTIGRDRPVARAFARAIERAPVGRSRGGWQRLASIEDVLPGDVFAWRRPRGFPSRNTGHVGFVADRPLPVAGLPGGWALRVADSTAWGHQYDTLRGDGVGGFGIGTLVFLADEAGRGTHYGWFGTLSEGYVVTPIVFGRVTR